MKQADIEIIAASDWKEARLYREPDLRAAVTNAPYRSVYGHRARIEFLLILGSDQYLIETKRQRVSGSVDEQLPYVYLNALENIGERGFVFVYDGAGWKPEALNWIGRKAADTDGFETMEAKDFPDWLAARL